MSVNCNRNVSELIISCNEPSEKVLRYRYHVFDSRFTILLSNVSLYLDYSLHLISMSVFFNTLNFLAMCNPLEFFTQLRELMKWQCTRERVCIVYARVCETYGTDHRKYILTVFGRILMGGPLSVLCLTASSFFSSYGNASYAIQRIRFTQTYRVTRRVTVTNLRNIKRDVSVGKLFLRLKRCSRYCQTANSFRQEIRRQTWIVDAVRLSYSAHFARNERRICRRCRPNSFIR